jgi:beta-lactamase class D
MRRLYWFLLCLLPSLVAFGATAAPSHAFTVDPGIAEPFAQRKLHGVFVAYETATDRWTTNDVTRAREKFLPASTFKIPNSLIALECRSIASVDEILTWDGKDRGSPAWNRDRSMRDAFRASTVWFYQELARRTGEQRMSGWLRKIDYGNADISGGLDTFWLTGSLRISAVQQIEFLRRLRDDSLPFRPETMLAVKEIMIRDRRDDWTLRAKTGLTALTVEQPVAWVVGWIESPKGAVFFATNLDHSSAGDNAISARIAITYENLIRLGALPTGTAPPL